MVKGFKNTIKKTHTITKEVYIKDSVENNNKVKYIVEKVDKYGKKENIDVNIIKINSNDVIPKQIKNGSITINSFGHNIISCNVTDRNTNNVIIYRRVRRNVNEKPMMKQVASIKVIKSSVETGRKNSSNIIWVDKDIASQGLIYEYRLVPQNNTGFGDFYDVVSKQNTAYGSFKANILNSFSDIELKEGINNITVNITGLAPTVNHINILRRNLTRSEKMYTMVATLSGNAVTNYEDSKINEKQIYEYTYNVIDKFGNTSKGMSTKKIQYHDALRNNKVNKVYKTETAKNDDGSIKLNVKISDSKTADSGISSTIFESLNKSLGGNKMSEAALENIVKNTSVQSSLPNKLPIYKIENGKKNEWIVGDRISADDMRDSINGKVKITTAIVDLDKLIDPLQLKRKQEYQKFNGTIPNLYNKAVNIFDESIVEETDINVNRSKNINTKITNLKVENKLYKNVIKWESSNNNIDFFIIERLMSNGRQWEYIGKTIANYFEDKRVNTRYRVTSFTLLNTFGSSEVS